MKIKCPVCGRVKNEAKGFKEPIDHTASYHLLISKIHEILKDTDGWVEDECQNLVIERLKSLLEDENENN